MVELKKKNYLNKNYIILIIVVIFCVFITTNNTFQPPTEEHIIKVIDKKESIVQSGFGSKTQYNIIGEDYIILISTLSQYEQIEINKTYRFVVTNYKGYGSAVDEYIIKEFEK